MAEGLNPDAPANNNVAADAIKSLDVSSVSNYDDNTSLDDIAGNYTNLGNQIGGIANNAAADVGMRQNSLINNDFGATNPLMYHTYYEPAQTDFKSAMRVAGTQKALDVGMERGKAAAEAAAEAAQNNYNNAYNAYENFRNAVSDPTLATVDTSLLGEGNEVGEAKAIQDFAGQSKEDAVNSNLGNLTWDRANVDWSNSETWSTAASDAINNFGVRDQYDSWSDEERQAFWDRKDVGAYFSNDYTERYIYNTMGQESVDKYKESVSAAKAKLENTWDYINGYTDTLDLEPIPLITVTNEAQIGLEEKSFESEFLRETGANDVANYREEEWIRENIEEQYQDEVIAKAKEQQEAFNQRWKEQGVTADNSELKSYHEALASEYLQFITDKVKQGTTNSKGQEIKSTATTEETEMSSKEVSDSIGFDTDTLRWYKSMKTEHPEELNVLMNQIAQAYGQANTLEVADGEKYYYVNGEYVQPEAGTVILFSMPGVVDNDGNIIDKDYEKFVSCFKDLNDSTANMTDEETKNLEAAMQESWQKYYTRLVTAEALESMTGTTMDADMYSAVLYRSDPSTYKDATINGKKISDLVAEFKSTVESNGHEAYVRLGDLAQKAYSYLGFMYGKDADGNLVQYNLEIGDTGVASTGQVGDSNNYYDEYTPAQAMALYSVITTSINEYQAGNNTDTNINPSFLDDDNAGWFADFGDSFLDFFTMLFDWAGALTASGVTAIGNNFIPEEKRKDVWDAKGLNIKDAFASIWPGTWGTDYWANLTEGESVNDLLNGTPKEGTLDYFTSFSNLQQQNLADMINPLLIESWFPDIYKVEGDGSNVPGRIGEGYTSRVAGADDNPLDVYGLSTMFANWTGFKESSAKLLGALAGGYVSGFATTGVKVLAVDAAKGISRAASNLTETIKASYTANKIVNSVTAEQLAERTAWMDAVKLAEQQAAKTTFETAGALGTGATAGSLEATAGSLGAETATGLAKATEQSIQRGYMRGIASMAASDNLENLTEGFATEYIARAGYRGVTKAATTTDVISLTKEGAQGIALRAAEAGAAEGTELAAKAMAAESIQRATLSLGTGLPEAAFEAMNAKTQRFFCKAFNSVVNGNTSGTAKSLSGQAFLRSIGIDGIKQAAEAVASATKSATAKGLSWGMEDTFRVLAQQGWDGASTRMLLKDFTVDFATDMVRDNIRNLSNPYLTNDGWQRQSIEEYFTNPYTYIQNLLMSGIQFGIQRGKAQIVDAVGTKKFYKYRDAYNNAGDRETADLYLAKMVKWSNKIEKNANKLMRKGVPYAKTRQIHDDVNTELNKAFDQSFTISDFDPTTGEYTKRMRTADEFSDFLKKTKLNTQERTAMAARYAVISFQDDYITNKAGLGERATQLGGNFDNDLNMRIWELEEEVRVKYHDSVKYDNSLDEYQKNQKMYKLYTDAIVEKYGNQVEGLRASLEYMYGKYLDKFQERKASDPNYRWRLGYTSNNSLYSAECDDVTAFGGSWGGRTIDRDASDINKPRDVETKDLLNAIKNGDDVYKLENEQGEVIKTYKLNPNGLNFLRRMTAYDNANTVHRFFAPIFGDNLQGREHLDNINMALASARNFDAVVVGTEAARAAAVNDGAKAQVIIDEMRAKVQQEADKANQAGKAKAENTAKAEAQMEKNRNWNAEHEEIIYKKAQDAQAAKDYFDRIQAEKHGAIQEKYKNTVQNILGLEGELGKFTAKQEYQKASGLANTLVKAYSAGDINSTDKRTLTVNDGTTRTVIDLSDTTLDLVKRSAANNQEYSADLVVSLMDDYYTSYGRKPQDEITTAERKTAYLEAIDALNQDSRVNKTNLSRNEYQKKVLMREAYTKYGINLYKKGNIPEGYTQGETSKKVVTGYDKKGKPVHGKTIGKAKENTSVYDTASTGFTIDGKPLLSKYAGDYGYNFDKDGRRVGRADETIDMVTKPIRTTLADEKGKVSQATERMIASSVAEAETYLKDENTADKSSGSEGVQVTPNKLAITLNKVLPDAELYFEAEHSGLIKNLQLLDKQGLSVDSYGMVMRRAITENPDMPISDRNDLIKASLFLDLMTSHSSRATMAVGSIDADTKGGSAFADTVAATDTVDGEHVGVTGKKQEVVARIYGETFRKLNQNDRATVQSCMESLQRASELVNVGGKYESKIMKDRASDLSQARDVTKAAASDFGKLAKSYYDKAVAEPTETNSSFVQSAKSFAKERSETAKKNNAKTTTDVTEADCMHALGVAKYEENISPYGNKNGQTYPEYLAARANIEGYKWNVEEGYSGVAADAYKLGSNNFGNHLEQMFNGAQRLATMFPEDAETLLKKADEYQTTYVAPQYQTGAQRALGVSRTLNSIIGKSSLDNITYTSTSTLGGTKTTGFTPKVVREFANVIKGIEEAETKFLNEDKSAKNFDYGFNRKTYLKDYRAGLERLNKMYKNTSAAGVMDLKEFTATIMAASSNLDAAGYGSVSDIVEFGIRDNAENTLRSVLSKVVDEATYNDYTSAVDGYNNQIKNFNNLKKTFYKGTDTSEIDSFIKEAEDNLKNYEKLNAETSINLGKKSFFTGEQLTDLSIDRTARNPQKAYIGSIIVEAGGHKFETEVTHEMGGDAPEITFRENGKDIDISSEESLRETLGEGGDNTDYAALRQEIMNNYNEIARERAKENPDTDYYEYDKKGELFATRPTGVTRGFYDDAEAFNTDLLKRSHLSMEELAARRRIADYRNAAQNVVDAETKLSEAKAGKAGVSSGYETKINNLNQQAGEIYAKYLELTKDVEKEKFEAAKEKMSSNEAEEAYKKSYKNIDVNEEYIKKTLSKEDYEKYTQALSDKQRADDFLNSDDNNAVYQSSRHLYMKDGANPTGFYSLENAKGALGYDPEAERISAEDETAEINSKANKKQRKKMQKEINKNQNKGSIHYKNQQVFEGLDYKDMDYNTRKYTLSSMLEYEKQFRDNLTADGVIDNDAQILVDKKYLDLLQRVGKAGEGIVNDKWNEKAIAGFINFTESASGITKSIQDWQLAGGFSNINAASLAKIRSAILNDPRAAKEYARIFSMAKNSNNVMAYVAGRRQFLYDMTMAVHDQTIVTDMNGALSAQQGLDDFGTLQSLVGRVMGHMDGTIGVEGNSKVGRAWGRISDDMDALFSDPTFKNTLPLLRMRMFEINYDEAVRYINKNIDNVKQIRGMDETTKAKYLKNLALKFSYAKTTDFFEPRKTRGEKFDEFFDNLFTEDERKVAASWTGAKRGDTLMDVASNVFFALRWKMTFGGDVINGLTNTPGALIRKAKIASGNGDVNMMGRQFMRSGNTTGVGTIIALSALAMIWNRSLGYDSVDWDDLSPIGIDGEWQVPPILLKFQTIGQMLMPNDYDVTGEKGIGGLYINPNKQTTKTDPFFSMFTIGNSVARTADFATNRNAYEYNNQRGLGFLGVNNPINQVLNNQVVEAVTDELLGANLLSPYKAMWEVLMDDTYYGNNIWEKKYLKDGSENPNYDPFRNTVASFAHILNWDWMLGGTNAWVKGYGSDDYENTGKIGSVGGSGVFQHEYVSAAISIIQGNALEGIVEAGELPIKFSKLTSSARTDFNVKVKNIITQYVDDYKRETGSDMNSVDATDEAYAKLVKKCANVVANWSAQNDYVLGQNQELVAYTTKALMCVCAGEYDDVANYVQGAYWKAQEITQIEHSQDLFLNDADLEQWIAEGKTQEEFTEEKNRRTKAYNQALDNEYQARIALKAAGISDEYLAGYAYEDYKAEQRSVNKAVFAEVTNVLESPIGEFDNFSELKAYYEEQIANTDNTKTKKTLAEKYNTILTDTLTPYINKYGGSLIMADAYYDGKGLANSIADYVIIPYGTKYYGKSPRANYLKDLFGVGYRDNSNMPSDKEVLELYNGAMKKISEGSTATANAMLERLLKQSRNGTTYMSSSDYSKVLKLKAHISAKGSYK